MTRHQDYYSKLKRSSRMCAIELSSLTRLGRCWVCIHEFR